MHKKLGGYTEGQPTPTDPRDILQHIVQPMELKEEEGRGAFGVSDCVFPPKSLLCMLELCFPWDG